MLIAFFPQFEQYEKELRLKDQARTPEEKHILPTVSVLLEYLRKDYRATLAKIANLTAHGEITFDLLYAILVPRTILVTECPITGEPRALQLLSATRVDAGMCSVYTLLCESIDSTAEGTHPGKANDNTQSPSTTRDRITHLRRAARRGTAGSNGSVAQSASISGPQAVRSFGRVQSRVVIMSFMGTEKINSLEAFPIRYHRDPEGLKAALLERGSKWASLKGIHHVHYKGTAALVLSSGMGKKVIKYNVSV